MKNRRLLYYIFILLCLTSNSFGQTSAQKPAKTNQPITLGFDAANNKDDFTTSIQLLMLMTILTLLPSILMTMTSFTRLIIVFHFLRQALGTQQMPPNQIMVGLAFFLTFFIMQPTFTQINEKAIQPYLEGTIKQQVALKEAENAMRVFMFKNMNDDKELALFIKYNQGEKPETRADVSTWSLIPAYIMHELKIGFTMGFLIYIPFLVIDMVISSILMAMGMMMLPPMMISLPFKLLLFVLVDGWYLLVESLITSFR